MKMNEREGRAKGTLRGGGGRRKAVFLGDCCCCCCRQGEAIKIKERRDTHTHRERKTCKRTKGQRGEIQREKASGLILLID